FSEKMVPAL
ncbi:hypothetical protein CP8484711_1236B, partial [Chlamydia psittaci 84-8471/1]